MKKLSLIKLGGSLITHKNTAFSARLDVLKRIAEEIKEILDDENQNLIIGHGGGSFPHVYAKEYEINRGFFQKESYWGFVKVQEAALALHHIVIKTFVDAGLKAVSFPLHNVTKKRTKKLSGGNLELLELILQNDFIPVVYGNVVFDDEIGCSVASTEEIFRYLLDFLYGNYFINSIILCGKTDGIYKGDFQNAKTRKIIKKLTKKNITLFNKSIKESDEIDVTGGMKHKVSKMFEIGYRVRIQVINGLVRNNLKKALAGDSIGTEIIL
jgi:isopentenyl phosphate kinase